MSRENKKRLSLFFQKINRMLTIRNQCIFFLFTLIAVAGAIFNAANDFFPEAVSITLYVFAAAGFVLTCSLWVRAILFFVKTVLLPFTKSNPFMHILMTDSRLRAVLGSLSGMGVNLIYAVFNGMIGITNHSAWYGSLSAYYLLLCAMRFLSVSYARQIYGKGKRKELPEEREWRVYKNCGFMLSVMSIALGGAVIMLIAGQGGKSYPGLMIYAVATYTFYKLTISIINMIKARKEKSALLSALRNIGYSDALVSLPSLQTALFAAFGQESGALIPIMNTLTGVAVCLMVLGLGIYMICHAKKHINRKQKLIEGGEAI